MKLKTLFRSSSVDASFANAEKRTITLSFSSEEPVERYFGQEILDHRAESIDLARLNGGANLLLDHDQSKVIGVVERAWVENNKGMASVRFSKSALGSEVMQDVLDGIRRNVSVGYRINKMQDESQDKANPVFRAIGWQPMEVSFVGVPADASVGYGRATDAESEVEVRALETAKLAPEDATTESKKDTHVEVIKNERTNTMSAEVNRDEVLKTERARVAELEAVAKQFPEMKDELSRAVESGMDVASFKGLALEKVGMVRKGTPVKDAAIGMSNKEVRNYSLIRAINAMVNGDWSKAGLEKEASDAAAKMHRGAPKGFIMPYDVMAAPLARTAQSTSATYGGEFVQTDVQMNNFIDVLRNRLVVAAAGARMLTGLVGDISIPKKSSASTAYWTSEGSSITQSNMATTSVSLSPKTVGAWVEPTKMLLSQVSQDVEALLRTDLADTLAVAIDLSALYGFSSLNQPKGILNSSLVNSVSFAARPTFAKVVDMETEVAVDNALNNTLYYVTNAKCRGRMKQTLNSSQAGARYLWEGNEVNGYPALMSNQMPSNLGASSNYSSMIFGDFSQLIIAMWGGLDITVDPYTLAHKSAVRIIANQFVDIAIRHPTAFCIATTITTT